MPGRDCAIGGGTQQASSAASSSLSVLIGAHGFSAAALPASVALTSTSLAIRKRDLSIGRAPLSSSASSDQVEQGCAGGTSSLALLKRRPRSAQDSNRSNHQQ